MAISVNTNPTALYVRNSFSKNLTSLASSVERLSSGLRINKAADDSAGLRLADGLQSQVLGLGQAARNANDAISITQIADTALGEAVDILNSIKTKTVEGAQGTLSGTARATLQEDIDQLLQELDLIIQSTSFNDQPLLTGGFTDKQFQIGAYAKQAIAVSLGAAQETKLGHLGSGELSLTTTGGDVNLSFYNPATEKTLNISGVRIAYNNSAANGMGQLAAAINAFQSETGVAASAVVEVTSAGAVKAGATGATFAINDVAIGAVSTEANDANGRLVAAVNARTASHGVAAAITAAGNLTLSASDGRAIKVVGLGSSLESSDAEMSTFGYTQIFQRGPYSLNLTDLSEGFAVAFSTNLKISGTVNTTADSTLEPGSILGGGSVLAAGWEAGLTMSGGNLAGDIVTTSTSTLLSGSVLASGSVISQSSILGGTAYNAATLATTAASVLQSGSVLGSGSIIAQGTYLTNDITTASGAVTAGTILSNDATITAELTLTSDMMLQAGSSIVSGSTFTAGSTIGKDFVLSGSLTMSQEMTLLAESTIKDLDGETLIAAGSTIGGPATLEAADLTVLQAMNVASGSTLGSTTELSTGSTIGGASIVQGNHTAVEDIYLAAGSILAASTLLKSGTNLTNNINTLNGTISSGTITSQDYLTTGVNNLTKAMTLQAGSVIGNGSTLAANSKSNAAVELTNENHWRLSDLSVLSREQAVMAMSIVDAALADLDKIRAETGAWQAMFESTLNSLATSKRDLTEARSRIMDIDFAEEVVNFTKMQQLVDAGAFSFVQANAAAGNSFNILQGSSSQSARNFFFSVMVSSGS